MTIFATNGYRMYAMTKTNAITRAKKAIATYEKALETGLTFDGQSYPDEMRPALVKMIEGQQEVIAEWKATNWRPGEW
jgi:hypothetical protein